MIGIFYGHAIFWTVFLICYGVAIIMVSFILYFSTQMKVGKEDVSKEHKKLLKQLTTFKEENAPSSKSTWKLNLLGMIRIVTTLWDVRTEEGRWSIYYHWSSKCFLVSCLFYLWFRELWRDNFSKSKIVLIIILQVLNIGFFIFGAVSSPSKFKRRIFDPV